MTCAYATENGSESFFSSKQVLGAKFISFDGATYRYAMFSETVWLVNFRFVGTGTSFHNILHEIDIFSRQTHYKTHPPNRIHLHEHRKILLHGLWLQTSSKCPKTLGTSHSHTGAVCARVRRSSSRFSSKRPRVGPHDVKRSQCWQDGP